MFYAVILLVFFSLFLLKGGWFYFYIFFSCSICCGYFNLLIVVSCGNFFSSLLYRISFFSLTCWLNGGNLCFSSAFSCSIDLKCSEKVKVNIFFYLFFVDYGALRRNLPREKCPWTCRYGKFWFYFLIDCMIDTFFGLVGAFGHKNITVCYKTLKI